MSATSILRHLHSKGSASASDLGEALRLHPGAVRAAIAQLESLRQIQGQRQSGSSDRKFSLTREGASRVEAKNPSRLA